MWLTELKALRETIQLKKMLYFKTTSYNLSFTLYHNTSNENVLWQQKGFIAKQDKDIIEPNNYFFMQKNQ
ncbi:hypothetical protein CER18_00450 [Bartonella tribocorum]|uniref:Uncharacterized protein n=1 Tax=Bartonella tribocorum TaxID=85701 RepID=A0A2M6UVI5_9HYPH|nr:hypothetical protein CER18_00450 [Bartonella tribocorum]